MPRFLKWPLLLSVAVVVVACGSDDSAATTAAGGAGTPTTASGSAAAQVVVAIQVGLTELGYYSGPVDGIYGPATTEGVRALQSDLGVTVDGRYGPETHDALVEALGDVENQIIQALQTELQSLGYYSGPIDGIYGPATTEAVRKVQTDCNITVDGIYGPQTHACLVDLGGSA